jgi:ribosomal protein S18 acetylase RimI-like enzyme
MSRDPTIRVANETDLDGLIGLAVAFRDHQQQDWPSDQQFREAFALLLGDSSVDVILALAAGNRPLGYVMTRYRYSAWVPGLSAELEDVFVVSEARRHGVGRRLVADAIARAEQRGCRLLSVTTNERNRAALALYATFGFRAERERYDGGRALWLERWRDGK